MAGVWPTSWTRRDNVRCLSKTNGQDEGGSDPASHAMTGAHARRSRCARTEGVAPPFVVAQRVRTGRHTVRPASHDHVAAAGNVPGFFGRCVSARLSMLVRP